ncbi:eight-cysteine-cluster domain-containing protein [Candidatus Micrarchaeota archaeon]|nr:eight-cysteine-cluster domain-containing protein [Candidatus Micrarchaeota archaeon]
MASLKEFVLLLLAIALTAIVGYGIYVVGMSLASEHGEEHGTETENHAQELLLAALKKPGNYSTYSYEYERDVDEYVYTVELMKSPEMLVVTNKDIFFEKTVYSNSTTNVLCITFDGEESCSNANENKELNKSAQVAILEDISLNVDKGVKNTELRIDYGLLIFENHTVETTVDGRNCTMIKYIVDYSKATVEQLNNLGLGLASGEVTYAKDQKYEVCIDDEDNILYKKFSAIYNGKPTYEIRKTLNFSWGTVDQTQLVVPELVNATITHQHFLDALNARNGVLACSVNAAEKDNCIKNYAIENAAPYVCLLAESEKDRCILSIAPRMGVEALCLKVDNVIMRDDCWLEIAAAKNDSAFCNNISNSETKNNCENILSGIECHSDSDCSTAGCSNQLCVPNGMNGTITTCEYLGEYECLNYTTCGCVNGKCAWDNNSIYVECMMRIN